MNAIGKDSIGAHILTVTTQISRPGSLKPMLDSSSISVSARRVHTALGYGISPLIRLKFSGVCALIAARKSMKWSPVGL